MLVADRCGALWARVTPKEEDAELKLEHVLEHLHFIQIQCPECGVLDLPAPSEGAGSENRVVWI